MNRPGHAIWIRATFFCVALLVPLPGADCIANTGQLSDDRPNILLILADDLGYSDLGCYGGEIRTPNIDALAAGGARFTQFYNSARCCPSRASLMTGLYPSQAGIGDFTTTQPDPNRGPGYLGRLNEQCVTLAEALGPAGYQCYYVGKWHLHQDTGPIRRGFDEFYGYTRGHSHDQYDADFYVRLPRDRTPEIEFAREEFYATDAFNRYALEFIRQGQQQEQPWFLFLGHSSPHFPIQAPPARADRYDEIYQRGWDVLREERFARMREIGLVDGDHWQLSDRSLVPVDRSDIANGYPGQPNPAWEALDPARRADLARRMAVFAAMVESIDRGVGQIIEQLRESGEFENTLILFLSDNGACYEWGPFGFDGSSRRGETILRQGDRLRETGGPGTHQSYGSGWANLGNTPFRMYKHFTHEGGICTPFIAHWPAGIGRPDRWVRTPAHVMDVMPTLLDVAGATYPPPSRKPDSQFPSLEGQSLLPLLRGESLPSRTLGFDHQAAHAFRDGDWKLVWSKREPEQIEWELYNLADDRCELNDLAGQYPDRVKAMAQEWKDWANRVGVTFDKPSAESATPLIANRDFRVRGKVQSEEGQGVLIAHGGQEVGYAVHLDNHHLIFDVRIDGLVTRLRSPNPVPPEFEFGAAIQNGRMVLSLGKRAIAACNAPGHIPREPEDPLDIGRDSRTAAGRYPSPNPLQGKVIEWEFEAGPPSDNLELASTTGVKMRTTPNVLFIGVDDLNDWIGCLGGHPQTVTPNFDRLAASGVLFTNAHCAAPACNPSRSAIFTGRAPHRSGMYDNRQVMREVMPDASLIPAWFREHGYRAAGSGKLLHYFIDAPSWDAYFPARESENPLPHTFYPEKRPVNLPIGGPWQYVETDWGAMDVTDEQFGGDWSVTGWIADELRKSHDRPFFLGCGLYRPHEPWFVPKKYFEPFPLETVQLPPGYLENDLDDLPPAGRRRGPNRYFEHIRDQGQWKQGVQSYLASIHFADSMLGRVLDALEEGPHADNTIVILWSDHGWQLGEKQHWQKYTGWRAVTRVPLIIRVPPGCVDGLVDGTAPGARCDFPVNLLDLYPTLTDLCGLPHPDALDGLSLRPLLEDPQGGTLSRKQSVTFLAEPGSYGLSTRTHRYLHYANGDEELYDIRSDPYEWHNLANQPGMREQLDAMRAAGPSSFAPRKAPSVASLIKLTWFPVANGNAPPSSPDGSTFDVYFINESEDPVRLFWMDRNGERRPYGTIAAGTRKKQSTRPGAVWQIADSEGQELGHFRVQDRSAQAIIPKNR